MKKSWIEKYYLLIDYYNENKNTLVPFDYKVITKDKRIIDLGSFVHNCRSLYKNNKLSNDKIVLLNSLDFVWEVRKSDDYVSNNWLYIYNILYEFYDKNGNLIIPYNYEITDLNGNVVNLNKWMIIQRSKKNKNELNKKKITLLNEIEFVWNTLLDEDYISYNWLINYNLAKEYYEKYGNLLIKARYVIDDNSFKDVNLGNWIHTQRKLYKAGKLSDVKINMLNDINMVWSLRYVDSDKDKVYKKELCIK